MEKEVMTSNGRGRVVHTFPNGQVVVEYPWGSGEVLFPEEVRYLSPYPLPRHDLAQAG